MVLPYIPPDLRVMEPITPSNTRPWHVRREGETDIECKLRLEHSCYACGVFIVDMRMLDKHEDECNGRQAD